MTLLYMYDTVEAHSCVDIVAKFADEQYTTIYQSTAGRSDQRVFVNCLQVEKRCKSRLFTWLQSIDVTNVCINKVNTRVGSGTKSRSGGCDWFKDINIDLM